MHLSLHRDAYEPGVDMTLSVMIGYDEQRNPITDTFSISVDFFLKIIERLKKLPAGNPMNDSIGVDVELSKGLVHFRSTTLYVGPEGSSKEEIEGITLTLRELMMIPEEDLERITIAPSQTEKIFYFKRGVASKEELPRAITYAQKRHGLQDCYVMDGEGNEMACLSFDGSEMTEFGKKKDESGDWEED